MSIERHPETQISTQERVALVKKGMLGYLKTEPANPDNITSVKGFCLRGIGLYLDAISTFYSLQHPNLSQDFAQRLQALPTESEAFKRGFGTEEDIQPSVSANKIKIINPVPPDFRGRPESREFSGIMVNLGFLDRRLPRYEYAVMLDFMPRPTKPKLGTNQGMFFFYNARHFLFLKASKLPFKSPWVRLLSLSFIEDMAKKQAVRNTKKLLETLSPAHPSAMTYPPDDLDQATSYVVNRLAQIDYHLGYLHLIKEIEGTIIKENNISGDQLELIKDLAFLRRADLEMGELTSLLVPIMQAVGEGRFEDGYSLRDFLLANFASCFPRWREKTSGGQAYPNVIAFVKERYEQQSTLDGVPQDYQQLFEGKLEEILTREYLAKTREEERVELIREQVLASRLLFDSIVLVSQDQSIKDGNSLFNPNQPVSYTNPIRLTYRGHIDDFNKLSASRIAYFTNMEGDETGRIIKLIGGTDMAYHLGLGFTDTEPYLTQVFLNLLYQGLLDRSHVEKAYQNLKEKGQCQPGDQVAEVLGLALDSSLKRLLDRTKGLDISDVILETLLKKITIIEDLIESLKAK